MRASNRPQYEAAVRTYAAQVASPEAPKTPANSFAYGILVGVCTAFDIPHTSEAVRADIADARAAVWRIHRP